MQKLGGGLRAVPIALIWAVAWMAITGGLTADSQAPSGVSFTTSDGGQIYAHLYGSGEQAVVLAHGKVFDKESWVPLAIPLAEAGLQVLAIDFRGYGRSQPGSKGEALYLDVLAAISYLQAQEGVTRVSVVGASMGGGAAARAAIVAAPGEIDRLILLAPMAIRKPEQMHANSIVYITAEADASLSRTRQLHELAPEPKRLEILPGDAHAQHIFKTDQADALVDLILLALAD